MIKGAIFDFDGTLFNSMHVWDNVTQKYLDSLGIKCVDIDEKRLKSMSLLQASEWIKEEFKLDKTTDAIMSGLNGVVRDEYFYNVMPKKSVRNFLRTLYEKGAKMAIASVSEYAHIDAALRRCELRNFFVEIFSCSTSQCGKNKPDVFNTALGGLQKVDKDIDKSNTYVFEDALYALEVAKNDGFKTVGVFDKSEKNKNKMMLLSDIYLESFEDLSGFWSKV